jgi:hypothetical protein
MVAVTRGLEVPADLTISAYTAFFCVADSRLCLARNQFIERFALPLESLRHGATYRGAAPADDFHDRVARLLGLLRGLRPCHAPAGHLAPQFVRHGLYLHRIGLPRCGIDRQVGAGVGNLELQRSNGGIKGTLVLDVLHAVSPTTARKGVSGLHARAGIFKRQGTSHGRLPCRKWLQDVGQSLGRRALVQAGQETGLIPNGSIPCGC